MFDGKFEVFDEAREFVSRTRPIFVERHDFSAKLFKNRETTEPSFSISAKGEHRFDIYRIFAAFFAAFLLFLRARRTPK